MRAVWPMILGNGDGAARRRPHGAAAAPCGRREGGDRVLVEAAAGGVGNLLVKLTAAEGAHVIATAGGPRKLELARSLGATDLVDYRQTGPTASGTPSARSTLCWMASAESSPTRRSTSSPRVGATEHAAIEERQTVGKTLLDAGA